MKRFTKSGYLAEAAPHRSRLDAAARRHVFESHNRLVSVLLTILLLLTMATPVSAHGCTAAGNRNPADGDGNKLRSELYRDGEVFERFQGTWYSPSAGLHIVDSTLLPRTYLELREYNGGGYARMAVVLNYVTGKPHRWYAELDADGNGVNDYFVKGVISSLSGTFEIRTSVNFGVRNFRFYLNGTQVGSWSEFPMFTPTVASVVAQQGDPGNNQFFGYGSDHFDWAAINYTADGTWHGWPSWAPVYGYIGTGYGRISVATQNVDFWDSACP